MLLKHYTAQRQLLELLDFVENNLITRSTQEGVTAENCWNRTPQLAFAEGRKLKLQHAL